MSKDTAERVDVEQPLLKENEKEKSLSLIHPNCPGCKHSYLQEPDAKLPLRILANLAALTLVNGTLVSILRSAFYNRGLSGTILQADDYSQG